MNTLSWKSASLIPFFISILTLSACSSQSTKEDQSNTGSTSVTTSVAPPDNSHTHQMDGATSRGAGSNAQVNTLDPGAQAAIQELMNEKNYTPADLDNPQSILAQRVIYFDYNQATIQEKYKPILAAHAQLLSDYPQVKVRLEGHADERGTREYNVALSERRAQTVRQYLSFKNVSSNQMETVAFGEEKPLVPLHNDAAWSKNRRVELNYTTY